MTKKRMTAVIAVSVLTLAVTVFIFLNSLDGVDESERKSGWVLEVLRPVFGQFVGEDNVTEHFIRKLAHFTEFGMLGCSLAGLCALLGRRGLQDAFNCAFAGLAVAVTDETIQIFSGRGSQVMDVLLDFSGAVSGIIVIWLVLAATAKLKRHKKSSAEKER